MQRGTARPKENKLQNFNLTQSLPFVTAGFLVVAVIIGINTIVLYRNFQVVKGHQTWVAHTYQVLQSIETLVSALKDADTGQRGYQISQDEKFLQPYISGQNTFKVASTRLRRLTSDNPRQQTKLDEVDAVASQYFEWLKKIIELRRDKGRDIARDEFKTGFGASLTAKLRDLTKEMSDEEQRLLSNRALDANQSAREVDEYFALTAITNLVLVFLCWFFMRRHLLRQGRDTWMRTAQARLATSITGDLTVAELCKRSLRIITDLMQIPVANFYVASEQRLELCTSIAKDQYKASTPTPEIIPYGTGLVGESAKQGVMIHIQNLPESYLNVTSSLGQAKAREVLIYPMKFQGEVRAVAELGSFKKFTPTDLKFIELISESVAAAVESSQNRSRLKDLLEDTLRQAEELQAQEEELRASNEELENRANLLKENSNRLQLQQEEMTQTNEELEQQAGILENQKKLLENKNLELELTRHSLEIKATELSQASQYKSEFLANMSHELRTPLNSLLILATLLVENRDQHLDEKELDFARTIHRAGTDLLNLISDILDLSKVEAGKLTLNFELVKIDSIMDTLNRSFRVQAESKGLTFVTKRETPPKIQIKTDRQRLEQILKNLVSNAVKFTISGSVEITAQSNPSAADEVIFRVKDTGIGVPNEKLSSIFEAFQQADGSTSREFGGTGLGLTISRELAALLGARIEVTSVQGQGSTFCLYLPLSPSPAIEKPVVMTLPARDISPENQVDTHVVTKQLLEASAVKGDVDGLNPADLVILIIEDDDAFSNNLINVAHEAGFKAIAVENGEAGLRVLRERPVHGVILDVKLPGASGLSILEQIKTDPKIRHLPIHMISAMDYGHNALRLGAIGYLTKPADPAQLKGAFAKIEAITKQAVKQILIVEDDEVQRGAIAALISGDGVKTLAVGSGQEALTLLSEKTFDCMVLDLKLPDISGFDLLDRMHDSETSSKPPVVIYTGKDLSSTELARLQKFSNSIVIKGARSPERLLDEVGLFLHLVETKFPENSRNMLKALREKEELFDGKSILVVDDDMRNVYALVNALERRGLQVVTARNGKEAVDKLFGLPSINLVLMDIMMPQMDGYEAMQIIRKDGRFKRLPIIALTAKAMKGDYEKCLEAGASDYMPKPIDLSRLISLLRVWLPNGGGI